MTRIILKLNLLFLLMVIVMVVSFPARSFSQTYKIGILANRGFTQAEKDWTATAEYLSSKLGKSFSIIPMDDGTLYSRAKEGQIDFFFTNSAMYVELNKLHNAQAIATLINLHGKQPMDQWGSAVIVKKDSPINSLADFKGKEFMCRGKMAFGGWLMAKRLFLEGGVNPEVDLKSLRDTLTHDNVVFAVHNGAVDGGSVRTGTLEKMAQDGKVKLEDFKVIHRIQDNFPLLHSSQLYPEYPMAACAHVPQNVRNEVTQALLAISSSDPPAMAARIVGWKKPADYSPVVECLAIIKHGSFGK